MAFTVVQCQEQLDHWRNASRRRSTGSTWSSGGRSVTRPSAEEIEKMLTYWRTELAAAEAREAGRRDDGVTFARLG